MRKGTVLYLLSKLEATDIKKLSEQAINETAKDIKAAQQEQLFDGLLSDGNEIEPEYTERTIEIKEFKGQPTDRVTLHDTGDWYAAITVEAKNGDAIINDTDSKTPDLVKKYTKKILGIGGQYKMLYIARKAKPTFIALFKKSTGL